MIKAEVITHENTQTPTFLDRCRDFITPTTISGLVLIVAIAGISLAVINKQSDDSIRRAANANSSTPSTTASPLSVTPPVEQTSQTPNGNTGVQGAVGATTQTSQTQLNATASTPDASQSTFDQQSRLNGNGLTNKIQ